MLWPQHALLVGHEVVEDLRGLVHVAALSTQSGEVGARRERCGVVAPEIRS